MTSAHTSSPSDDLAAATAALGLTLIPEQLDRLAAFEELLLERAVPLGLVAEADAPRLRERHLLDCARAALAVRATDVAACDLGSGAGLPGLVVAVCRPELRITLLEPQRRRAAFLELAVERLSLQNAEVRIARAEELEGSFDLCFARALASLERCWALALPHLHPGGRLVYFAGAGGATGPIEDGGALPGVSSAELLRSPFLESAGPLVIMGRQ